MIILCLGRFSTISSISGNTASRPRSMKLCPPTLITLASGRIWITGCVSSRAISCSSVALPLSSDPVKRSRPSLPIKPSCSFVDTGLLLPGAAHNRCGSAFRRVPKLYCVVHTGGRYQRPVIGEGHKMYAAQVSLEHGRLPAGGHVPDSHRVVEANRSQRLSVRRESAEADPGGVAFERLQLLACVGVEELHVFGGTSGCQHRAVGREHHRVDRPSMYVDGGDLSGRGHVPKLDSAVYATGGNKLAVGRVGQRLHAARMAP